MKLIRRHRRADSIPREAGFQIGARKRRVSPHSIMPSDPAKYRASVLFRRFFALFGGPLRVRRPSRPAPVTDEHGPADSIIGAESPAADSAASPSIRCERGALAGTSRLLRCPHLRSRAKRRYSKIPNRNNILRGNFVHKRVLFVQHPSEKGQSRAAGSGSFVACAEVLGNCDRATEGGIPRSSR